MNSNLIRSSTLNMTDDQWYDFRTNGIGASEVAVVMGLSQYKSSIELFYEKIGQRPINKEETAPQFWGTELESCVAEKWQYWDPESPDQDTMIKNYRAENIIRKCERVNAYISNPAIPHLFVSLDRRIHKKGDRGEGALEVKTISGFAANQWESGIPPMYVVQLQTQLMVCDFNYGELAILKDGRWMEVLPFEKNENIQESINEMTKRFWDLVTEAKPYVELKRQEEEAGNLDMAEFYQSKIDELAPAPDNSLAYENYLKEKYKSGGGGLIKGEMVHYDIAKQYQSTQEHISKLEEVKTECGNKLKAVMGDFDILDFAVLGKVTWKKNAKDIRVFKVLINR
jgi:predicted phage-related endonuclease